MAPNIKKHSLYFSSYRRLYKGHSCILKFFSGANCKTRLCTCADIVSYLCKKSKWVWSGNTTITNCRQPCGTARKSRSTTTRHQVWDKMAPNFRCKFKVHWPSCLQEKSLYNPVSISSKQARLWRNYFYDKCHFELSTGDAIMKIAVSFSLRFA